ncbi:hypothetical protein [Acidiphilium acidophilum]|uniref:hypothetical protein n=1 Tax=Acidiphilium acidophilum TaxID=76588 RepID=UPI002E8E6A07|nr:hypothetical protein [Acidiphilium acidophilum]
MKAHKKALQYLERPGNRPGGIPENARYASAAVGVFALSTEGLLVNYLVYINKSNQLFVYGEPFIFIAVPVMMAVLYSLRSGRLFFIKLFVSFCQLTYIVYGLNWIISIFQTFYYNDIRNGLAVSNILLLVLISPFVYLMHRALKRSRWLDPKSLPHEWEIPAINDPTSISYRPPKKPR